MRIIAGSARGRTLASPRGMDTRPTLDRVRESLFSILQRRLEGAAVLDLFAGSGALGLEAISRGAARAVFVDRARAAQAAVRQNIETVGAADRAKLLACDWRAAVNTLHDRGERFDLIFLDPPYQMADREALLTALAAACLLQPDGRLVLEHAAEQPANAKDWTVVDRRRYGEVGITFYSARDAQGDASPDDA